MSDIAFSKVIFNGTTLMDDTGNTAASSNMLNGVLAQNSAGQDVTGALVTAPASTSNPAMDGTASAGSASTYSRGDHVHPTDTSRQSAITYSTTDLTAGTSSLATGSFYAVYE